MMSWVRALVCVIQHGTCRGCCSRAPEEREHRRRLVARLLGHAPRNRCCARRCAAACRSSAARPAARARAAAARASPPAGRLRGPPGSSRARRGSSPARNVPVVSTTARAENRSPICVTTPTTRSPSRIRSSTACWKIRRFGWFSSRLRIACRYSTRSACARVARTAGPLRELRMRNWIPASSVAARHGAAQRVDFLDEVALADAADRRVARHLAQASRRCG